MTNRLRLLRRPKCSRTKPLFSKHDHELTDILQRLRAFQNPLFCIPRYCIPCNRSDCRVEHYECSNKCHKCMTMPPFDLLENLKTRKLLIVFCNSQIQYNFTGVFGMAVLGVVE